MNNLAYRYQAAGRFDDARALLRRAIVTGERVYGSQHPEVGICFHTLGELELAARNYADAAASLTRAVDIYRRLPTALHLPLALYELGQVAGAQGDGETAAKYVRDALAAGYKPAAPLASDPHFALVKDHPGFRSLLHSAARPNLDLRRFIFFEIVIVLTK